MKRELNSRSRRKWVVGGAMVFGSIALLSTGFATWVIGASVNTVDQTITPTIDTISESSLTISSSLDSGNKDLVIGDPAVTNSGFLQVSKVDADLTVGVNISVTSSIEVELRSAVDCTIGGNEIDATALTDANFNGKRDETATKYTVFTKAEAGDITWTNDSGDGKTWAGKTTVTFTLGGTVWNSGTIADFYNSYYTSVEKDPSGAAWTKETIAAAKTAISNELTAITNAMSGLKVTLGITTK